MKIQDQDVLIETPAFVELEGTEVLTFVARKADYALYKVIGFDEDPIKLIDYRQKALENIDKVLNSKQIDKFPEGFCYPAWVRIFPSGQEVLIELFDLGENIKPDIMLWITTDLEEPIPDYKYAFFRIKPRTASSYSFVSLFNYHRFQAYFDGRVDQILSPIQVENQI